MNQIEVINEISSSGISASELLEDKLGTKISSRFKRITGSLVKLMYEVQKEFPDAGYYTASGGFHLMLTDSHSRDGHAQQDGVAESANPKLLVGDGDF